MKNINLQRATIEDVGIFISLEKSVIGAKTYSGIIEEDEAKEEIEKNIVYFIKINNVVVGSIQYIIESDGVVYLSGLVVGPNYQGQGIAHQAVEKVLEEIGVVEKVYFATHPQNVPVIKIGLSLGFVIDGWKDNFYGDGEPRILMSRNT